MVGRTDRHYRFLLRGITQRSLLYTEMMTAASVVRRPELLEFDSETEGAVVLQLAGCEPLALAEAARRGAAAGYAEINLNLGCPSTRATAGGFGACMMARTDVAEQAVAAIAGAVQIPVSVKCRLGVDDQEGDEFLSRLVETLGNAGSGSFSVHARKAWLKGLNPRQNRSRPPLQLESVEALARAFPQWGFTLNGGLASIERDTRGALESPTRKLVGALEGIMLGRAVWRDPWCLARADSLLATSETKVDTPPSLSREAFLERGLEYLAREEARGVSRVRILRGWCNLKSHTPGSRRWRCKLGEVIRGTLPASALREGFAAEQQPREEQGQEQTQEQATVA